jgi:hypothetical protein
MQSSYAERFTREMGCTETEWLRWLPAAMGDVEWQQEGASLCARWIPKGQLNIQWTVAADRQIANVRLPVLRVEFGFADRNESERLVFMKRFDLYMQRGGG